VSTKSTPRFLHPNDTFVRRHIGPDAGQVDEMLATLGLGSLEQLVSETLPAAIRARAPLALGPPRGEHELLAELREVAERNRVFRSYIGMGYHGTIVPPVIQRNVLENPGWYTQYTPYQAEISQGRLEALLVFQTMVSDLTGLPLANASLLDEATAAAEAMHMCHAIARGARDRFFVSERCHPQTITVVETRARSIGIDVVIGDHETFDFQAREVCGALIQYPDTEGRVADHAAFAERVHASGATVVVATDLLALALLRPPGEFGADIAIGSAQRFGVPMGYGGPHAAFMATREEFKRQLPGRLIGISRDAHGKPALRMAMQTREQHIRRDKATSNICTAQVLLAIMSGMYAVYHGPDGIRAIAERVHGMTKLLAAGLGELGLGLGGDGPYFDTLRVATGAATTAVHERAAARSINLRPLAEDAVGVALDETVGLEDVRDLLWVLAGDDAGRVDLEALAGRVDLALPEPHARRSAYLQAQAFTQHHAEHEMLRYLHRLEARDLSLTTSMIPLGSCTMKLNGTSEMLPVTWPEFGALHPFAPLDQAQGYQELFRRLEDALCEITGFDACSLQPNAGSQGELAGLLVIRAWHESRGDSHRKVCLIPISAHGTNPASAVMAGMKVVTVDCDELGNIDVADLEAKAARHEAELAALIVTYPSTHGVFEEEIVRICERVHAHGGQVYLDGANMNAQVGLCRPGDFGADVCHLNLHKTFCIPHGGGGPGMGPIAVAEHLAPFLPGHPVVATGGKQAVGAIAAAPWGSSSILPISWVYIALMGADGLRRATEVAILSANYMAHRLSEHFEVLYANLRGRVAHEFIVDFRPFEKSAGISVEDVAKRLIDYGFHSPTMSFPVAGTLMIEPTESETKEELDRLCDALIAIRGEIRAVEEGRMDRDDNPLTNAPHTVGVIAASEWNHPYSREEAAFPAAWVTEHKYWPYVARVDNGFGDRNLVCTCPPIETYAEAAQELATV
jgi:glycine dehydrogenase